MTDEETKGKVEDFLFRYLEGCTVGQQVDRLEDLSAELLVRADDLRAEMAAAEEAS